MHLLHRSKYFSLYQCDLRRCFYFETKHKFVWLSFCQLLALRQKVNAMDLEAHFDEDRNKSGIEILIFCNREHVILLDTYQLIDLKAFMKAAFVAFESAPLFDILG